MVLMIDSRHHQLLLQELLQPPLMRKEVPVGRLQWMSLSHRQNYVFVLEIAMPLVLQLAMTFVAVVTQI